MYAELIDIVIGRHVPGSLIRMNIARLFRVLACLLTVAVVTLPAGGARAAERRAFEDIRLDDLIADTQVTLDGAPTSHMALAWWIPYEYWLLEAASEGTDEADGNAALLGPLRGVSLLAVVQVDIGEHGNFQYYDEASVRRGLKIELVTAAGRRELTPLAQVDQELAPLLAAVKPLLAAAMGNLGNNLYFFVLDDRAADGGRVMDPFAVSTIEVELRTAAGKRMAGTIETPLNALFVPRHCANGKPAHVSWKFCPWDGKRLD